MKTNKFHVSKLRFIIDALSTFFLLVFLLTFILQMIYGDDEGNIIIDTTPLLISISIGVIVFVLLLIYLWIVMRRHVFYEKDNQFVVEKGLLVKSKVEIPYDHIHTISLKRNLIHLILGVAKIQVDTGAIRGVLSEADLLLKQSYAEQLKYYLEHKKDNQELDIPIPDRFEVIDINEEVFYKAKWYQLLLIGLLQTWTFVGLIGVVLLLMIFGYIDSLGILDDEMELIDLIFVFSMMTFVSYLIASIFMFVKNFGYQLKVDGNNIEYKYGLFNKVVFKIHTKRINALIVKQPLGYRLFKYYALEASVIGINAVQGSNNNQSESQYLMPIVRKKQLQELLELIGYQEILKEEIKHPFKLRKVNFIFIPLSFALLVLLAIDMLVVSHEGNMILLNLIWLYVSGFIIISDLLFYKQHGYQIYEKHLVIQKGVLSISKTLINFSRIQATKFYQGPILLIENTGHIHIVFKGLATNRLLYYFDKKDFNQLNQKIFNI